MAVAATLTKRIKDPQGLRGIFTLVFSGSYATGGDPLDFTPKIGYTTRQPKQVEINGIAGYKYEYDLANKKVIVRQGTGTVAPSGELPASAYPAGVTGDTVVAIAVWF